MSQAIAQNGLTRAVERAAESLDRLLGRHIFNAASLKDYLEVVVEAVEPMSSLLQAKARLVSVRTETPDTKTLVLAPNRHWRGFEAGQHVTLELELAGRRKQRTFTIASAPHQWHERGTIEITVKRMPDGTVTPWLHDALEPGHVLGLSQAHGAFCTPAAQRLVYIAAGSGITPVMAQLRALARRGDRRPVTLLYYARHYGDFIFAEELERLAQSAALNLELRLIPTRAEATDETPCGPICGQHLGAAVSAEDATPVLICGPAGFMDSARERLGELGVTAERIHQEHFGVAPPPATAAEGTEHRVHFARSGGETLSSSPRPLLDIAEEAGLNPPHGCRMGICHSCKCDKVSGRVLNLQTGEYSSAEAEPIQLCINAAASDVALAL